MVVMTDEIYKLLTAPRRTKYRIEQTKSRITALRYTLMSPNEPGVDYDSLQKELDEKTGIKFVWKR